MKQNTPRPIELSRSPLFHIYYFDSDNPFIKLHGDERTFVTKRDRILCYTKFREDVLEHLAIVLPEEYSTSPIYDHYWSDDVIRATRLPQTHLLGSFIRSGRYRDIDESVIAISLREFGDYCLSLDLYRDIDELINELSLEDGPVLPYCGLTVSDLLSGEDMLSPHWVEDDILYLHDWRKFENA